MDQALRSREAAKKPWSKKSSADPPPPEVGEHELKSWSDICRCSFLLEEPDLNA
jgi:hypothetical protein